MGKRIITQRRGRGTTTYRCLSHRYKSNVKYKKIDKKVLTGKIVDFVKCPGHSAPLAEIFYEDKSSNFIMAPIGLKVGDKVEQGEEAKIEPGSILPLGKIGEGTTIYNIESSPGDGGKFCRAAGTSAKIISFIGNTVVVKLPSKKEKKFNINCRATVGVIAGSGMKEKPLVKAGKAWHIKHARGRLYPRTSGVAMNAVDHPYGSGRGRQHAKIKVVSRDAPPGQKVGPVAARRTGKRR